MNSSTNRHPRSTSKIDTPRYGQQHHHNEGHANEGHANLIRCIGIVPQHRCGFIRTPFEFSRRASAEICATFFTTYPVQQVQYAPLSASLRVQQLWPEPSHEEKCASSSSSPMKSVFRSDVATSLPLKGISSQVERLLKLQPIHRCILAALHLRLFLSLLPPTQNHKNLITLLIFKGFLPFTKKISPNRVLSTHPTQR